VASRTPWRFPSPGPSEPTACGVSSLDAHLDRSWTISAGVSYTSVTRSPTTWSARPGPSGILSPGRHCHATVVNDGGSAGRAVRGLELEGERHRSRLVVGSIDFFEGLIVVIRKHYYVVTPN